MDVQSIITKLQAERDHIRKALHHLEQLAQGETPRLGRPPKWLAEARKKEAANS